LERRKEKREKRKPNRIFHWGGQENRHRIEEERKKETTRDQKKGGREENHWVPSVLLFLWSSSLNPDRIFWTSYSETYECWGKLGSEAAGWGKGDAKNWGW